MKVHLSRIAEGPVRQHLRLRVAALPRLQEMLGESSGEVEADLTLHMVAEAVEVTGTVRATVECPCALCLEPVTTIVEEAVMAVQAPVKQMDDLPDEHRLSEGELDVDFFRGDEIDLTELVEEQALLMLPPTIVCREDCRGLCAGCGRNLNEEACACAPDTKDHPFAAMKALLDSNPD